VEPPGGQLLLQLVVPHQQERNLPLQTVSGGNTVLHKNYQVGQTLICKTLLITPMAAEKKGDYNGKKKRAKHSISFKLKKKIVSVKCIERDAAEVKTISQHPPPNKTHSQRKQISRSCQFPTCDLVNNYEAARHIPPAAGCRTE
jgi:hypothetical protein